MPDSSKTKIIKWKESQFEIKIWAKKKKEKKWKNKLINKKEKKIEKVITQWLISRLDANIYTTYILHTKTTQKN